MQVPACFPDPGSFRVMHPVQDLLPVNNEHGHAVQLEGDPAVSTIPVLFISGVVLDQELLRARLGDPEARLLLKPVAADQFVREGGAAVARARRKRSAA